MNCKNLIKIIVMIFVVLLISTVTFADKAAITASNSVSTASVSSVSSTSASESSSNSGSSSSSDFITSTVSGSTSNSISTSGSTTRRVTAVSISEKDSTDNSGTSGTETQLSEVEKESQEREEEQRQENTVYIRKKLEISDKVEIKDNTVNVLITRKSQDNTNFEKLTKLATAIVEDNDKEVFVDEVITMDKYFIEELSDRVEKSSEIEQIKIKKQVENYIDIVKNKEQVKVEIKETQIEKLFNKELDMDSLIEEIWSSWLIENYLN